MKCLSIKQPWADLILQGKKPEEFRSRDTKFRGEFCIHASKKPDMAAMKEKGFDPKNFTYGCIVGKAKITATKQYGPKDYGWQLADPKRLIKPIPKKGQLSFFEVNL